MMVYSLYLCPKYFLSMIVIIDQCLIKIDSLLILVPLLSFKFKNLNLFHLTKNPFIKYIYQAHLYDYLPIDLYQYFMFMAI